MRSSLEIRLVFGLFLACIFLALPAHATGSFNSSVPNLNREDQIFSRPLSEFGSHIQDPVIAADISAAPVLVADGQFLPETAVSVAQPPESPDATDVIRHRGFVKALLIILLIGGLVRLLTSPMYQKFIADVLDPKAF